MRGGILGFLAFVAGVLRPPGRLEWARRARRARAVRALESETSVLLGRAAAAAAAATTSGARAVLRGALEPAGALVRAPIVDRDALAWSVWALDGGVARFVEGAMGRFDLVDDTGRARVRVEDPAALPYTLGEVVPIDEPLPEWKARAGRRVEEWLLALVVPGTLARVSGRVAALPRSPRAYRDAGATHAIEPTADGAPVLLAADDPALPKSGDAGPYIVPTCEEMRERGGALQAVLLFAATLAIAWIILGHVG